MSDLERFNEIVDDIWEMVFGTERRPKPKRARTKKGRYRADDKSTKEFNEAWVGGKAPKKNVMSKKEKKALNEAMKKAAKLREKK